MKYIVSYQKPNNHYIDIEYIIDNVNSEKLEVQLPAWRPGRYELGNFAKNVQKWDAFDDNGNILSSKKLTKYLLEVETKGSKMIHIKYNYFANEINAGSSYLDDKQLYINGVNCFLYIPDRVDEQCNLELQIPENYEVASGLKETSKHQFICKDFHELVDCPLIASSSLQHHTYIESGVNLISNFLKFNLIDNFYLFISNKKIGLNGKHSFNKIKNSFLLHKKCTNEKVNLFGDKLEIYKLK